MKNVMILILLSFSAFVSAEFLLPSEDELISPDKLQLKIKSLSRDHLEDFETHARIVLKDSSYTETLSKHSYDYWSIGLILEYLEKILNSGQVLNNRIANEIKSIINFTIEMSGEDLSNWLSNTGLQLLEKNVNKIGSNIYFEAAKKWVELRLEVIEKIEKEKEEKLKSNENGNKDKEGTSYVFLSRKYELKEELINSLELINEAFKAQQEWKQVIQDNLEKIRKTNKESARKALVNFKDSLEHDTLNVEARAAIDYVTNLVFDYQMPLNKSRWKKELQLRGH